MDGDKQEQERVEAAVISEIRDEHSRCRRCGLRVEIESAFCPHCGCRLRSGMTWWYHPVTILLLAFLVLGPFALPLVWCSRRMGRVAKITMAIVILLYTALCLYLTYKAVSLELAGLQELNDVLKHIK